MGTLLQVDLARDDKTGGNARVEGEASAYLLLVLEADGIDDLMYLLCRPDGTQVVILVGFGDTEEGDYGITDILFNEALVAVNDLGNFAEDPGRDLLDLFGVELLGHRRVAGEVGEEDGDVFSLPFRPGDPPFFRGVFLDFAAALPAKVIIRRDGGTTMRADQRERGAALPTEFLSLSVVGLAFRTFHRYPPSIRVRGAYRVVNLCL